MAVELHREPGTNVLEIRVTDKLTDRDYSRIEPVLTEMIGEHGKIRLLFDLLERGGLDIAALWEDVKFEVRHVGHVERLAVVGEGKLQELVTRTFNWFTKAEMRYFEHTENYAAREWLKS